MAYKDIRYEVGGDGIARLTLNKPDRLNALSWGTWAEIEHAIDAANNDDAVKVVLITGEGRGFSAGTDLTGQGDEANWHPRPVTGREAKYRSRYLGTATVYNCTKPTIAAVNGVAVGAGFSLSMACDIRIASEVARFSAIFVKRAIVADTGCTWFLPRLVGLERALEMMYTGRMVGAAEAKEIGLVSEVVPADQLIERATALATEIAKGPSLAVELNKRLAQGAYTRGLEEQIELEEYLQAITHRSEDAVEGRQSFLEKRDPVFKGR
ncbi:MAG: enoyl-CoA hydratase/isomerase family protein [Dehalococcoidia bacterium]|nr:enoyl-CoA hydratase/isomerase family protein [Dehalococcoidia bacterium]